MKVTGYKVRMQKSTVFLYMEYTTFMDGLIFVKKVTVLKLIYRFNAIPIKTVAKHFADMVSWFSNKCKVPKIANTIAKNKARGCAPSDIAIIYL